MQKRIVIIFGLVALILTFNIISIYLYYGPTEQKSSNRDDLIVPFYIYESEKISELWKTCYHDNPDINLRAAYLFIEQLRDHPWRTYDPDLAAIFVLPIIFMQDKTWEGPRYYCHEFHMLIKPIVEEIKNGIHYKKMEGKDHLLVDPWYKTFILADTLGLLDFTNQIIIGSFGLQRPFAKPLFFPNTFNRHCQICVPFDPNFPEVDLNPAPIDQRPIDVFFLGDIAPSKYEREQIVRKFPKINGKKARIFATGRITGLEACNFTNEEIYQHEEDLIKCHMNRTSKFKEWTRNSKIGLMIRGSDYSSERIYSNLAFGTVSVIFSDYLFETAVPFQCFVPWKEFTFMVNTSKFLEDPYTTIEGLVDLTYDLDTLNKMQKKSLEYQKEVLFNHPESNVAQNILRTAVFECFSPKWIYHKNLSNFLNYKCKYLDVLDTFGGKFDYDAQIN